MELEPVDLATAVQQVMQLVGDDRAHLVATLNADQALNVSENRAVAHAFSHATLCYADGAPVVALSRLLGHPMPMRVTGADLMPAVCAQAAEGDVSVAILGGLDGVASEAARRLQQASPGLRVVAALAPPLGFERDREQDRAVVDTLLRTRPDIVFVCLGSPKQELWVVDRLDRLPPSVYCGVGAAVDFAAGTIRRAPESFQQAGFEWLWRLSQERRLARRYLLRGPRFFALAARELRASRRQAPVPAAN